MPDPKYIIEFSLSNGTWVRSWGFGGVYTMDEAQSLLDNAGSDDAGIFYRITPLIKPRKPYRRHAAVTQLELRGAIAMLSSACKYLTRTINSSRSPIGMEAYQEFTILYHAKLAVTRQLETL
jgi:hypothetical protein